MRTSFLKKWYPKIFAKPRFAKWNIAIVRYGLRGLGVLNYASHDLSGENHFLKWFIKKYRPSIVFDIGANKGDYAKLCRKYGFVGELYGFEPNPKTYKILNKLSDEKNLFFNLGFSDKPGNLDLYYEEGNDESTHATIYKDSITKKKIVSCKIKLETIDQFLYDRKISHIDLLKIDTEGNEFKILEGAKKTIEAGIIQVIQFEITGINVVSRVFFKDFYDLLFPNYDLYRLLPDAFLPIENYEEPLFMELFAYQNIIAIRK